VGVCLCVSTGARKPFARASNTRVSVHVRARPWRRVIYVFHANTNMGDTRNGSAVKGKVGEGSTTIIYTVVWRNSVV